MRVLCGCCAARAGVQSAGADTLRAREQRDVVAAAVRGRCDGPWGCQAAGWTEREEDGLRLGTGDDGDGDVKSAGLAATKGNDRSCGW